MSKVIINEILREGNSLSQIHLLLFRIFLKLVSKRVDHAVPIFVRLEIVILSLFATFHSCSLQSIVGVLFVDVWV